MPLSPSSFEDPLDLLMGAPIGIFTSSPEGRYLSVNPAMARIFGYESPQALIDASSETESDMPVDPAGGDTFLRLLDIQDEIFDRETRHFRRDGSEVWVSTSARAVRDGSGNTSHFLGFVTEITPRKQVEAALAHERNLYRDLVASQPAGVYRLRVLALKPWGPEEWVEKLETNYTLEMVSDRFCEILGATRAECEASATIALDRMHPEDRADFVARNVLAVDLLSRFTWEGRIVHADGDRWVHFESVPRALDNGDVLWTGILLDISGFKQAERASGQRARELAALHELSMVVGSSLSLDQIVAASVRVVRETTGSDMVYLFLRQGERLVLQAVCPQDSEMLLHDVHEHRVGECLCGLAVLDGEPLYSSDILSDDRCTRQECKEAGILVRELKRKLSPEALTIHQQALDLYDRVQRQQRSDTGKIYSLHEPGVSCISKGKAHKKYEFGAKVSVTVTKTSGIIVGALSFQDNPFDGHTLPAVLSQVESIVGQRPTMAICDRGYRGKRKIGVTSIEIPESGNRTKTTSDKRQARERFRRRAAIEPIIGHLKNDHRMLRNYLKGQAGDSVNLFMACAAFNFRKFIRILCFLCLKFLGHILRPNVQPVQVCA